MLKVVCSTSASELQSFFQRAERHIIGCMRDALIQLCQECDERARNNDGGWRNRTGNLRSSIGGAVYENGKAYFTTDFATVLNGSRGSAKGRALVQSLASQYSDAVLAMVLVAGEEYAESLEALESKDVLESTRLYAESVVKSRLEEAKERAVKEINSWKL